MSVVRSWSETAPAAPRLQRAQGHARVGFKRRGAATALETLYQSGVLRLRLPRVEPGEPPEAVLLNTAGGLTGGDRLAIEARWRPGTAAALSAQAAERVYRALDGEALVETRLRVEAGAAAEWLPQETILFDGAALRRDLQVELAGDARFLGVETLIFGRAAMGEQVRAGRLRDAWRVRRDGRLLFAEALDLAAPLDRALARPAVGGDARAFALLLFAAEEAASLLEPVRACLQGSVGLAAASAWNGLLLVRFAATDGAFLRRDLLPVLSCLRGGRPAPRVWRC